MQHILYSFTYTKSMTSYLHLFSLAFVLPIFFFSGCQLLSKQKQETPSITTQNQHTDTQISFTDLIQNKNYNCSYPTSQAVFKLYCILKQEGYSYQYVQSILPHPIYISGPHTQTLAPNSRVDFGHYNPNFLNWLEEQIDTQLKKNRV